MTRVTGDVASAKEWVRVDVALASVWVTVAVRMRTAGRKSSVSAIWVMLGVASASTWAMVAVRRHTVDPKYWYLCRVDFQVVKAVRSFSA